MRITKELLDSKLRTLNSVLKRPMSQWPDDHVPGTVMGMNVGHLLLDSNGYGMRLVEIVSSGGAERAWSDSFQTKRQMFDYLVGVLNGITLRNELTVRQANGGQFS